MIRNSVLSIFMVSLVSGCTFIGKTKFDEGLSAARSEGSKVTLYSIDPGASDENSVPLKYGYPVLGGVTLNEQEAENVIDVIYYGAWKWRIANSVVMSALACFNPRHIVSVKHDGITYDYVVCFECESIEMYKNGVKYSYAGVLSEQSSFDSLLISAGIALPKN